MKATAQNLEDLKMMYIEVKAEPLVYYDTLEEAEESIIYLKQRIEKMRAELNSRPTA